MVVFVPLIILLGERLTARGSSRVGDWLLVIIFMVGASDAKITILPLVLGALVLYAGSRWILERRVGVAVLVAIGLTLVISGAGLSPSVPRALERIGPQRLRDFRRHARRNLDRGRPSDDPAGSSGPGSDRVGRGILFGLVGLLLAPLVGLAWIFRRHGLRLGPARAWLLSVLAAGLLAVVLLDQPGVNSQLYFLFYGLVAGYILSAEGLRDAWLSRPQLSGRNTSDRSPGSRISPHPCGPDGGPPRA